MKIDFLIYLSIWSIDGLQKVLNQVEVNGNQLFVQSLLCSKGVCHCHLCFGRDIGFSGGASGKEPASQCRRHKRCRFYPWVPKFPGGGHGNPLQYSCLENPMDRGAWQATYSPQCLKESDMNEVT